MSIEKGGCINGLGFSEEGHDDGTFHALTIMIMPRATIIITMTTVTTIITVLIIMITTLTWATHKS